MRIAFITYEFPPDTGRGGIGTYTVNMANLLTQNGFDVYVFAGSLHREEQKLENGYKVYRLKCLDPQDFKEKVTNRFSAVHKLQPFNCIESPEIHANALNIKKQFPDLPLIIRIHAPNSLVESVKKTYITFTQKLRYFIGALKRGKWDLGYWKPYNKQFDIDYKFTLLADYIVTPTIVMKNWVVKYWQISHSKIEVVANPLDIGKKFQLLDNSKLEPIILFYGRLNVLKGLVTATYAMAKILKKNTQWEWYIIGEDGNGPFGKTSMKKWMKEKLKEVADQVTFIDSLPYENIPSFLNKAQIVVLPSLFESFSYVCAESMMAGKAVIGSKNTGISSLIKNNQTGMLADPYKTNEWVKCIQTLIDDPNFRNQLGVNAQTAVSELMKENFHIVNYYTNVCDRLVD